jgi:hypothetical protein
MACEAQGHLRSLRACTGTKAGAAKPIGNGLAVVDVNPYGCNAPAVPLQSWNIDLQQVYLLHGVALNALTIPSQGLPCSLRTRGTTLGRSVQHAR